MDEKDVDSEITERVSVILRAYQCHELDQALKNVKAIVLDESLLHAGEARSGGEVALACENFEPWVLIHELGHFQYGSDAASINRTDEFSANDFKNRVMAHE